jgi:hypothetical protein
MVRFLSWVGLFFCGIALLFSSAIMVRVAFAPHPGHPVIFVIILMIVSAVFLLPPILGICALLRPAGLLGANAGGETSKRSFSEDKATRTADLGGALEPAQRQATPAKSLNKARSSTMSMPTNSRNIGDAERAQLARANKRVTAWSLLLGIPLMLVFSAMEQTFEAKQRRANCPTETFLTGTPTDLAVLAHQVAAFLMAYPFAILLVSLLPWVCDSYNRRAALLGQNDIGVLRKTAGLIFLGLALVTLLCAPSVLKHYCLSPQGIVFQDGPGAAWRQYSWSDVTRVRTYCSQGKKGWSGSFDIELKDGAVASLPSPDAYWKRDRIHQALQGRSFEFDDTGVPHGCNAFGSSVLTNRP